MLKAPFVVLSKTDAESLIVDRQDVVFEVVTTAAQTRVLPRPAGAGQKCKVVLHTDGGDLTLTVTGGFNADGDTTITFDDAGDFVKFESIQVGSLYYWRVTAQEGTGATTEDLAVDSLAVGDSFTVGGTEIAPGDMTPGSGVDGTGTIVEHSVVKIGGLIKTEILIDLTGLHGGGTAGDIIGVDGGEANCHIGQITDDINGTIIAGRVTCFETPAGGDPDIDIWGSCDEATGAQDAAITGLTGEEQLINHGDWTAEDVDHLSALPDADGYLYLTNGTATDAAYTAGILLVELWGK